MPFYLIEPGTHSALKIRRHLAVVLQELAVFVQDYLEVLTQQVQ
jgi:hypothetical protein